MVQPDADSGVFPADAQGLYEGATTADKEFVTLPGDHYFMEPAQARDAVADTLADWLTGAGATITTRQSPSSSSRSDSTIVERAARMCARMTASAHAPSRTCSAWTSSACCRTLVRMRSAS